MDSWGGGEMRTSRLSVDVVRLPPDGLGRFLGDGREEGVAAGVVGRVGASCGESNDLMSIMVLA